jgi:hypothetical protein
MTERERDKMRCEDRRCDWCGHGIDIFNMPVAPHPFISGHSVTGCPGCREIDTMRIVCDEPGCWEFVTCGTPEGDDYRRTCDKHRPT